MYMLKVTIAATGVAQRFIPTTDPIDNSNTAFQNLIAQNNGANAMHIGDSAVTTTNGIRLSPSGDSLTAIVPISQVSDLKDFWVVGTAADVLNLMVFP